MAEKLVLVGVLPEIIVISQRSRWCGYRMRGI